MPAPRPIYQGVHKLLPGHILTVSSPASIPPSEEVWSPTRAREAGRLDPVGGAPLPLAAMLPAGQTGNKLGSDSKTVADLLVGVTQVLGKRTIGQLNYAFSNSSGYLTDPYKLLSVVDPITGDPVAGPGGLSLYLFEGRPDARTKHSLPTRAA